MFVLLKQSKDVAEQRRIQAVLMSASDAFPLAKIAELTGLGVHLVRVHARDFLREEESYRANRPGRGGVGLAFTWPDEPILLMLMARCSRAAGSSWATQI